MRTVAKRLSSRTSRNVTRASVGKRFRNVTPLSLLALVALFTHSIDAQSADHAFTQTAITVEWSESPDQLAANSQALNTAFAAAKGSQGARFANYAIRNPSVSRFEMYDQEGRYITAQDRVDYSHELELRLKSTSTIDFEALPQSKQLTVVIDAVAKTETEIRRLVHSSEVDAALAARARLNTPSSLTITLSVTDVDEPPVVAPQYSPSSNHNRGFLLRMNASGGSQRFRADQLFQDPEQRPLFLKANAEDVEIREFLGYSPNFGDRTVSIGSTEQDTNFIAGNSPVTDGTIVRVNTEGANLVVTPVADTQDGIRKAEIWVRGWDQRGPTAVLPRLDPATAESLAKITVLVQTGQNQLPRWPGNATGFSLTLDEGFTGPLTPDFGNWNATDPDNDQITYSLLDTSTRDACGASNVGAGISFASACIRLESTTIVNFEVHGELDYETVRANPIGRFTLAATDSRGAVAEAMFTIRVRDIDEPISGGFKTSALSIYLPTTTVKRFDLSDLFVDPEQREILTFRAVSGNSTIVTVNEVPAPVLQITAVRLGRTTIHAWATGTSGGTKHSSMTVVVKDDNNPPEFPGGVSRYQANVAENAPIGTKLSTTISATDPDFGDVLSFSLQENAFFRLSDEGLMVNQIQLATKALLDFETQANYLLTLTVSDDVDSADVQVFVNLLDIDESVRATSDAIPPISMSVNGTETFDAKPHFIDDEGQVPNFRVSGFDASIVDIFVRSTGEVQIFGKRNGTTDVTLTATDTSGGVAAKRFTVTVETTEPPIVNKPVGNQSMQPGLLELSLAGVFSDPDSDVSITEVSSSNEDVLLAILPSNEPLTLVLYAWRTGTAEVTLTAEDPAGNEVTHIFTVTVTDEEAPVTSALIPDQTLSVGQRLGTLSLLDVFSTVEEQPTSYTVSSNQVSTVNAVVANSDVIAWWESLNCVQKVAAVGDSGTANTSNPYCQSFILLSVQHKVIVRAVAGHHALLHGISVGSAQITVSATYATGAITSTTFTATVEAAASVVAAAVPQRVGYLDETISLPIRDLFDSNVPLNAVEVAVRGSEIVRAGLTEDLQAVEIRGLEIGSTNIVLIGKDSSGEYHVVRFSIRIANRAPQVSAEVFSLMLEVGEQPYRQDLYSVFTDAHALRFELLTGESNAVDASVQGSDLVLSPRRKGVAELTVRATDSYGASANAAFEVTVSENLLNEVASKVLAGYGRAVLSSVSSVIGRRLNGPLAAADIQPAGNAWAPISLGLTSHGVGSTLSEQVIDGNSQFSESTSQMESSFGAQSIPRISQKFTRSDDSRYWTIWTDADTQAYQGDSYRGRTRSYYIGTDVVVNSRIQAGLAGSQTRGSGDYSFGNAQRWVKTDLTFVTSYARYQFRESSSIWAIGLIGNGEMATTANLNGRPTVSHDLRTTAVILGATSELVNARGLDLAWNSDIAHLSMDADSAMPDQDSLTAEVERVRSGLTTSYKVPIFTSIAVEPFATVNLRYDGGSDQEGLGIEAVGGTRLSSGALRIEFQGRRFELREGSTYVEQGYSISTTYNPSIDSTGWSLSLSPTWGHSRQTFDPFVSNQGIGSGPNSWIDLQQDAMEFSVQGSLRYGFLVHRDRFVVTPFIQSRSHTSDVYSLGIRLQGNTQSTLGLEVDLRAQREGMSHGEKTNGYTATATLRF